MKGSYVLLFILRRKERIRVGSLGVFTFERGRYAYVGSAMNSLERRTERHFRKEKKKRWHIDYLLEKAKVEGALLLPSEKKDECIIANILAKFYPMPIKKFGSTDCSCYSHLFYIHPSTREEIERILKEGGFERIIWKEKR